jgi:hypothetical protein
MWIKLDFTPFFVGVLIGSLALVAIGIMIRVTSSPATSPHTSWISTSIIVIGAIPAFLSGFFLISEPIANWADKRKNRTTFEELQEDRDIQGIRFLRGAKIEWHGKFMSSATPAQPQLILGIVLEGKLNFTNTLTNGDLHVATDLETGTLATDQSIDGVPCKAHHEVEFFGARGPDPEHGETPQAKVGKLRRCTPSADFEFSANQYAAVGEVTLNGFDGVRNGVLAVDQDVDGHWCKGGTEVERPENRPIRFTLARDETISGIACKAGNEVVIEPVNGRVTSAVLAHDQEIAGIPCRGGEAIGFAYGDGSYPLESCVIRRPVKLMGVEWPAGSALNALARGWLEVTLPEASSAVVIGEVKAVGRSRISFSQEPHLLDSVRSMDADAYAEMRGGHFADLNFYQGSAYGHLAEAATVEGIAYGAGDLVRFPSVSQK